MLLFILLSDVIPLRRAVAVVVVVVHAIVEIITHGLLLMLSVVDKLSISSKIYRSDLKNFKKN